MNLWHIDAVVLLSLLRWRVKARRRPLSSSSHVSPITATHVRSGRMTQTRSAWRGQS